MTKQELKDSIALVVNTNGSGGITGANLQEKLFELVDACYTPLLPNGVKGVTVSRDLQSDDAGYALILTAPDTNNPTIINIPSPSPLSIGDNFSIIVPEDADSENNGWSESGGAHVRPLKGDLVLFTTTTFNNLNYTLPFNSSYFSGGDGQNKTLSRYLYDSRGYFEITKSDLDILIGNASLVPGTLYKITGCAKYNGSTNFPSLYDDGTDSGTTLYLKAISSTKLDVQGMGVFYNPKYNQAVDGFGIWENKMYGKFSSISGNFDYQNKEAVTADNSATGILLADGMIQWVSGDWSTATSITGDVSSATADVAEFVSPSYGVGDKVIWGGYSWTNVNGNVGASTDVLNLNAEWSKNVYDTTNYNIAYDVIEYDYTNDMVIRRHEIESNVDIRCSKVQFDYFALLGGFIYHSISVQQFGNSFNLSTGKGQLNINVNGGYSESVNFCGSSQLNLTFGQGSSQLNLTFGQGAYQTNLTFGQVSYQSDITFGQSSYQSDITFGQDAYQGYLIFGQDAYQTNLTFGQVSYQSNLTFGQDAAQGNLTFGQDAYQNNLTFGSNANQYNLTFGQHAYQYNLTFGQDANQFNLTFGQDAYQSNLTFNHNIIQRNIEFDINTQLDYNSQTLSTSINNARFRTNGGVVTIPNISTATYIYDNTLLKDIYTRPDGTLRLKYMNDSDVLTVVDVNA